MTIESEPKRVDFLGKCRESTKNNWTKVVYPSAVVGALVYSALWGKATVTYAVDTIKRDDSITGLVANKGSQPATDVRSQPIKCVYDDYCPVDNTSFIQNPRYYVTLDNCNDTVVDSDTRVQTCDRVTYQTTQAAFEIAVKDQKVSLPSDSRKIAEESVTK